MFSDDRGLPGTDFHHKRVTEGQLDNTRAELANKRRLLEEVAPGYDQLVDQVVSLTDAQAALTLLVNFESSERDQALAQFYKLWQQDALVLDKWFSVQAASPRWPKRLSAIARSQARPFSI